MNRHTLGRAPYHHDLKRSTGGIHGEQLEDARVQCPLSTRKLTEAIGWVEVLREGNKLDRSADDRGTKCHRHRRVCIQQQG